MDIKELKNVGALTELDFKRIQTAYREMIKTEGWKYLTDDINALIKVKENELMTTSVKADDIRIINQLGRDIQLYKYFISIPNIFIENAERHFKRKENKE